jgi:monoamine oxidase
MQGNENNPMFDIVIIGAGASGLIAASEIAAAGKKVAVIEAEERIGGRMFTISDPAFNHPIELGAEFVHGELPITREILRKASADLFPADGSIWQHKAGKLHQQEDFIEDYDTLEQKFAALKTDMPVNGFIEQHLQEPSLEPLRFTLKNYVEGYYAADAAKASTYAMREDLEKDETSDYRTAGGYGVLVQLLEKQCREAGVSFFLGQPVLEVQWQQGVVNVVTEQRSFRAEKVLVTVSIGVLQADGIPFVPALPQKLEAAKRLGFGNVVKINLQFREAFWKNKAHTQDQDLGDLCFLFSEAAIPTWWTQHPKNEPMLTGWLAGPRALQYRESSEAELVDKAIDSLSQIFTIEKEQLRQLLTGARLFNWSASPHFQGAYSFEVVNGAAHQQVLLQPEEDTVFFAGEGLHHGPEIGTVEAALQSGKDAARRLIAAFGGA